jgi:DNA repair protein RadC
MPKQEEKFYIGHRERLKEKFLEDKLTEYELLELLLSFAIPRRDVKPLSRTLIKHFGSVYYVMVAEYDELIKVSGVGRSTAILIKLICEMMKLNHAKVLENTQVFYNPKALEEFCRMQIAGKTNEEVHVIYLDANFKMIKHELHSRGSIESSNIYVDKILQYSLNNGVKSIVLLHNHPVTDNMFSSQDIQITQTIADTLETCGLHLYDHYVVASGVLYSMREKGFLNKSIFHIEQFRDFATRT